MQSKIYKKTSNQQLLSWKSCHVRRLDYCHKEIDLQGKYSILTAACSVFSVINILQQFMELNLWVTIVLLNYIAACNYWSQVIRQRSGPGATHEEEHRGEPWKSPHHPSPGLKRRIWTFVTRVPINPGTEDSPALSCGAQGHLGTSHLSSTMIPMAWIDSASA